MFQFPGFASVPYVFRYGYLLRGGFPHSEIFGSKPVCRLPEAYRKLLRPSSPVAAKASTVCAYSLDHITPNSFGYMCSLDMMQHTLCIARYGLAPCARHCEISV